MEILTHLINNEPVAEIISDDLIIIEPKDALDLMGETYSIGTNKIILRENQLSPGFFDLKTKLSGEILQKFSNYNFQLAIIGDFSKYKSKSLHDFIFESNKGNRIFFLDNIEDALIKLAEK